MLDHAVPGQRIMVEADRSQVDNLKKIARVKGASIVEEVPSEAGRPLLTLRKLRS